MALSEKSRNTMFETFRPQLGEEATAEMLSIYPSDDDRYVTERYLDLRLQAQTAELRGEMAQLRGELRGEMNGLRGEMGQLRSELRGEMAHLSSELRGEMNDLRSELRGEMGQLRGELRAEMSDQGSELRGEMAQLRVEMQQGFRRQTLCLAGIFGGSLIGGMALAAQIGAHAAP